HGGVVDRRLVAFGELDGDASLGAGRQPVAQADVGERAPDHHLVVAAAGAVRVEVGGVDAAVDEPHAGGAVLADRAGGGDVVGGDAVAQHGEDAGAGDVADGCGRC